MSAHTKGPWEIDIEQQITARVNGGNRAVAKVWPTAIGDERAKYDRMLIASAPTTAEMAMAFTLLVERYVRDDTGEPPVSDAELAQAMYALRSHIAAATGSTA